MKIAKEINWPNQKSRGWYAYRAGGAEYLTPSLKWQLGVIVPENCFVKTRKEARERLKQWKAQQTTKP